jgi:hypothetical protein
LHRHLRRRLRFVQGGPRRRGRRRLRSARSAILESVSQGFAVIFASSIDEHGARSPRGYNSIQQQAGLGILCLE